MSLVPFLNKGVFFSFLLPLLSLLILNSSSTTGLHEVKAFFISQFGMACAFTFLVTMTHIFGAWWIFFRPDGQGRRLMLNIFFALSFIVGFAVLSVILG